MARKTPKAVLEMLKRHDNHREWLFRDCTHKVGDQTLPMRDKLLIMRGLNLMMENTLHEFKCYHGFSYKKEGEGWYDDKDRADMLWDAYGGLYGEIRIYGRRDF